MKKDSLFIGIVAIIGAVTALILGQFLLVNSSADSLRDYSEGLLDYSVSVAAAGIDIFDRVDKDPQAKCSDADLNELRFLAFHQEQIEDIGRIEDGKLVCTAGWGRFEAPLHLPTPQRLQPDGTQLWTDVQAATDPRLVIDMAANSDVVTFTSPAAFKSYRDFDSDFSALVLTRDGDYVYQSFGDTKDLLEQFREGSGFYQVGPWLTASTCDEHVDICVVASLSNVNILTQPPSTSLAIACAGAMTAAGIGMVALRRRRARYSLENQTRRAVAEGRVTVVYQPLMRLKDGQMVGVEALARLTDEFGDPVSPEIFVRVAEESGFIGALTRSVTHRALVDLSERLNSDTPFYVSINISATDAVDPTFVEFLDRETRRLGISANRIVLELTERSTVDDDILVEKVDEIRRKGYGFVLDDFGMGYSSLAYLSKLPITGVKADKIFVHSIGKNAISSRIFEQVCALAEMLDIKLVAEGIETQEQVSQVLAVHPEAIGQGWLFGRPVAVEEL